ncbi:F-box/WD repeat-containing protein 2-like [Lytechinus pictus]|uniref:F-box/WD repeat-containing protein 2-like n=1 Tax=Lytechinus pictus TaxID=7653 RepID=UPI00240D0C25|nr:F-box/WD repeat-containing protein 2-like isoform X1 [Lytechinus pictus]XP_054757344.1 F-box/WD repeat-containing protein 2-like isoform X1 [Lytechinus pictus]
MRQPFINMDGTEFKNWLCHMEKTFVQDLNNEQRCSALDCLIASSGDVQLRHLSTRLEGLLKRDFLRLLPKELANYLLSWLDPITLGRCCQVSHHWNKMVTECTEAWQQSCRVLGIQVPEDPDEGTCGSRIKNGLHWKTVYQKALWRLKQLRDGSAFDSTTLQGHTARVYSLHYRDGKVASGSDDLTVRLWDVASGKCLKVLQTHTVADIKFDDLKVITASFDNTIACWDLISGERLQQFSGHSGAVFSIDYSDKLDLLVSGSADETVKLWRLSDGNHITTLNGHSDWVIQVLMQICIVESEKVQCGDHVILTMDKTVIKVWPISSSREIECAAMLTYPSEDSRGQLLLPRLQFDGKIVACSSDIGIMLWDFATLDLVRLISPPELAPTYQLGTSFLVSMGRVFTLSLDPQNLHIIYTQTQSIMSSWKLPIYRRSKRGSNFVAGCDNWLCGLMPQQEEGLVFATSMPDHSIHLVRWRTVTR